MIKNYIKTAIRSLWKHKIFSFINIIGLAVGLTCFTFISVFVYSELNYDRYPVEAKNIYRVELSVVGNGDVAHYPDVDYAVGEGIKNTFPEVKTFTRIFGVNDYVKNGDKQFKEQKLAFADSNFLQMFSIHLVEGDEKNALNQPNTMVITKSFAEKYFGHEDPMGKSLAIGVRNRLFKVTGVIDKVPDESHFHFDAFLYSRPITNPTWSNLGSYTYLLLNKEADAKKLEAKFPQLVAKYVVPEIQHDMGVSLAEAQQSVNTFRFTLIPLTKIHLYSNTKDELEANGDIKYVYIFSALAVFILLLACVNFINLSTARAVKRSREVGIRKVMGSIKTQLILQFLSESILLTLFSMVISYLLIVLLLPYFNQLTNKNISFEFFVEFKTILALFFVSLLAGILAGIYPAFFLSSFNPIKVLKGVSVTQNSPRKTLRSGLIVFQFVISTALIIATIVVYQQLHYMQNKKLGYDKDQVLFLPDARLLGENQLAFKQQLLQDNRVVAATISRSVPGGDIMDGTEIYPKNENGNGKEIHANISHIDYDYLHTMGIHLLKGRNFSADFPTDTMSSIIVNEAAVRQLGWTNDNALGKSIVRSGQQELTVIGVMEDFNYASVKQEIAPMMFMLKNNFGGLAVKIRTADISGFLVDLGKQWKSFNPLGPLEFFFLDEKFASLYASEQRTKQIFSMFAVLAIIIASLGLFGLSAYVLEQRTREIGIRKVLGASVKNVLLLVSKEFLSLIIIAFAISVPVAWWAMHSWLQSFAYRISIGAGVFVLSGVVVVLLTLLTISFQSIKAAIANPVKTLRNE